jgi:hypothetical protein
MLHSDCPFYTNAHIDAGSTRRGTRKGRGKGRDRENDKTETETETRE